MIRIALACLGLCFATNVLSAADDKPVKKVLFIGIDGCRVDALAAAKTPNIDGLVNDGIYFADTDIICPRPTKADTISGPGWSNQLTGVWPDKHGVLDNSFKGSNYEKYPHFFTRLKQVRPEAKTVSLTTWEPIKAKILSGADDGRHFGGEKPGDYIGGDRQATDALLDVLKTQDPDAVVLYLGNVDETGHKYGFHPKVPQYNAAIEEVDMQIGRVLSGLKARPTYAQEDWLIIVCTDHGGLGTGHGGGHDKPEIRRIFLIVSGRSALRGRSEEPTSQVDIVPTALTHLGIPIDPTWELDGRAVGLKN